MFVGSPPATKAMVRPPDDDGRRRLLLLRGRLLVVVLVRRLRIGIGGDDGEPRAVGRPLEARDAALVGGDLHRLAAAALEQPHLALLAFPSGQEREIAPVGAE